MLTRTQRWTLAPVCWMCPVAGVAALLLRQALGVSAWAIAVACAVVPLAVTGALVSRPRQRRPRAGGRPDEDGAPGSGEAAAFHVNAAASPSTDGSLSLWQLRDRLISARRRRDQSLVERLEVEISARQT